MANDSENYLVLANDQSPITGDSGIDYGQNVIDLFKYGVGSYLDYSLKKFETKNRFETFGNQLYQNGLPANNQTASTQKSTNYMPWLIGGGVLLLAVFLLKK